MRKSFSFAIALGAIVTMGMPAHAQSVNQYLSSSQVSQFCDNVATSARTKVKVVLSNGNALKGDLDCTAPGASTKFATQGVPARPAQKKSVRARKDGHSSPVQAENGRRANHDVTQNQQNHADKYTAAGDVAGNIGQSVQGAVAGAVSGSAGGSASGFAGGSANGSAGGSVSGSVGGSVSGSAGSAVSGAIDSAVNSSAGEAMAAASSITSKFGQ